MTIESLIQDQSVFTLDCAKATLKRDSVITIEDELYWHKEFQAALNMKDPSGNPIAPPFRIVGDPPAASARPMDPVNQTRTFRSAYPGILTIDCMKGRVGPNEEIVIPENFVATREVQTIIRKGWLFDSTTGPTIAPALDLSDEERRIIAAREAKRRGQARGTRPMANAADTGSDDDNSLLRPSEVRMPAERPKARPRPAAPRSVPAVPIDEATPLDGMQEILPGDAPSKGNGKIGVDDIFDWWAGNEDK